MKNSVKLFMFDTDGNTLFDGFSESGNLSLQPGDTLWVGTDDNRKWTKVIKVVYGFDTDSNTFVVDILVSLAEKFDKEKLLLTLNEESKPKSDLKRNTSFIDHGINELSEKNHLWVINNGDIILRLYPRFWNKKLVPDLELQVINENGPKKFFHQNLLKWQTIEIKNDFRLVTCTLLETRDSEIVVGVTETIFK